MYLLVYHMKMNSGLFKRLKHVKKKKSHNKNKGSSAEVRKMKFNQKVDYYNIKRDFVKLKELEKLEILPDNKEETSSSDNQVSIHYFS